MTFTFLIHLFSLHFLVNRFKILHPDQTIFSIVPFNFDLYVIDFILLVFCRTWDFYVSQKLQILLILQLNPA